MDRITVSGVIPGVSPAQLRAAFLDADQHAAMTGAPATVDGARFTAWEGYIWGETVDPGEVIVQTWRTSHFPEDAPDSRLEIHFAAVDGGTEVRFEHSEIPAGQGVNYEGGWVDFYITPMQRYFGG